MTDIITQIFLIMIHALLLEYTLWGSHSSARSGLAQSKDGLNVWDVPQLLSDEIFLLKIGTLRTKGIRKNVPFLEVGGSAPVRPTPPIPYQKNFKVWKNLNDFLLNKIFVPILIVFWGFFLAGTLIFFIALLYKWTMNSPISLCMRGWLTNRLNNMVGK